MHRQSIATVASVQQAEPVIAQLDKSLRYEYPYVHQDGHVLATGTVGSVSRYLAVKEPI